MLLRHPVKIACSREHSCPKISSCHTFDLLRSEVAVVPSRFPKAISSQWLRPRLSCIRPMQVFPGSWYFPGVSHQSGRDFLKTAVWEDSYWIHPLFSFIHLCHICVMLWRLLPHNFLITYLHDFLPINLLTLAILISASQTTKLLIFIGKHLGRELLDHMISQVGFSEKDSIFGIKPPFSFTRHSLPLKVILWLTLVIGFIRIAAWGGGVAAFEVVAFVFWVNYLCIIFLHRQGTSLIGKMSPFYRPRMFRETWEVNIWDHPSKYPCPMCQDPWYSKLEPWFWHNTYLPWLYLQLFHAYSLHEMKAFL